MYVVGMNSDTGTKPPKKKKTDILLLLTGGRKPVGVKTFFLRLGISVLD